MRITGINLQYFNAKGLKLLYHYIKEGIEQELIENGSFMEEECPEVLEEMKTQLRRMEQYGNLYGTLEIAETVEWLEKVDQDDTFGPDGWEVAFGLEDL